MEDTKLSGWPQTIVSFKVYTRVYTKISLDVMEIWFEVLLNPSVSMCMNPVYSSLSHPIQLE